MKPAWRKFLEKNWFAVLLVLVFLVYGFAHLQKAWEIQFNLMGSLEKPVSDEVYLTSYPAVANYSHNSSFTVFSSRGRECDLCGSKVFLEQGESTQQFSPTDCAGDVLLYCDGKWLFFKVSPGAVEESIHGNLEVVVENKTAFATLTGEGWTNGFSQVVFLVDGEKQASPLYSLNGSFVIREQFPLLPGQHEVSVEVLGSEVASAQAGYEEPFHWEPILTVLAAVFVAWAYRGDWLSRLFMPLVLSVAFLVIGFRLAWFGLEFIAPLLLLAIGLFILFKQKGKREKLDRGLLFQAVAFAAFFALFVVFINFAINDFDIWGAYYFRHAQTTLEQGTTSYFDALSYLGRQFTYPPLFFEFSAQLSKAFQTTSFESIRVPLDWLYEFLFAGTAFLLFRQYSLRQRLAAAFIFVSHWALLMTASGIGLHMLAFSLLNISLLLIYLNPALSIVSLSLAFSMHPLTLVFFPFYLFALTRFKLSADFVMRSVFWFAGAVALALPFYLPIFARAGLPYEIIPSTWGYLLTYGWWGVAHDFLFLLPLFIGTVIFGLLDKRYRVGAALMGVFLLMNVYVSLRSGPITVFMGACLFPLVFAKQLKNNLNYALLFLLFFVPTLLYGIVVMSGTQYYCTWGLANDVCVSPFEYVRDYTPSGSSLALNPIYGHMAAYKARRTVLADLYVEYADEGKWVAENQFYYEANQTYIESFGVDYAVLDDWYETPRNVAGDRVYDNGYLHVFLLDGEPV